MADDVTRRIITSDHGMNNDLSHCGGILPEEEVAILVIKTSSHTKNVQWTDRYLRQRVCQLLNLEHDKSLHSGIVGPMSSSIITQSDGASTQNQIFVSTLQARFVACAFRPVFLYLFQLAPMVWVLIVASSMTMSSLSKTTLAHSILPSWCRLLGNSFIMVVDLVEYCWFSWSRLCWSPSLRRVDSKIRDAVIGASTNMSSNFSGVPCRSPSSSSLAPMVRITLLLKQYGHWEIWPVRQVGLGCRFRPISRSH